MVSRKDKDTKNPISGDTARKIWLAGIGAYGRAFSEAQESLSKVTSESSRVFDDLVQKGEVIETMVSIKGKGIAKDVMEKTGIESLSMDDRIEKMRAKLRKTDGGDVHDIEARLDAIEGKLDAVLEMLTLKKRATRKPAAKKTSAKSKK